MGKDKLTMGKDKHTSFMRAVELPRQGPLQFEAHEKAKFLGVWAKDHNTKTTKPHLVLEDCPTKKQITYRFLVLEGEAPLPLNERWVAMGFVWGTKGSFGSLFMGVAEKGAAETEKEKEASKEVLSEEVGQHVEAFAR